MNDRFMTSDEDQASCHSEIAVVCQVVHHARLDVLRVDELLDGGHFLSVVKVMTSSSPMNWSVTSAVICPAFQECHTLQFRL